MRFQSIIKLESFIGWRCVELIQQYSCRVDIVQVQGTSVLSSGNARSSRSQLKPSPPQPYVEWIIKKVYITLGYGSGHQNYDLSSLCYCTYSRSSINRNSSNGNIVQPKQPEWLKKYKHATWATTIPAALCTIHGNRLRSQCHAAAITIIDAPLGTIDVRTCRNEFNIDLNTTT